MINAFIIILVLLVSSVCSNDEIFNNYQLRGMYISKKNKAITTIINDTYKIIYKVIIQRAIICETNALFTILCIVQDNLHSPIIGITDEMLTLARTYNISFNIIRPKILDKLKISFPGSAVIWKKENMDIIDNINKNQDIYNCVLYTLIW
jgi:hypothetical protein